MLCNTVCHASHSTSLATNHTGQPPTADKVVPLQIHTVTLMFSDITLIAVMSYIVQYCNVTLHSHCDVTQYCSSCHAVSLATTLEGH